MEQPKSKVQFTLNGEIADPICGFYRPEFVGEDFPELRNVNKEPFGVDLNYFYVEYYGETELFKKLREKMKQHMKGPHTIDPIWFYKLIMKEVQNVEGSVEGLPETSNSES